MPTAKFRASSTPDAMKPEEGNDSLDTFIRQAIGKEPYLSFSRTNDSPVQWIQLLHALDQQDLPGWPLLTPLKVQMQKCDKCSREFCSPINYRRHIRVHQRSLNVDKDVIQARPSRLPISSQELLVYLTMPVRKHSYVPAQRNQCKSMSLMGRLEKLALR